MDIELPEVDESDKFEKRIGIVLTFFAALLAINDVGADRFGTDELLAHSEMVSAYQWYSGKGIKEDMVEGRRDLLLMLVESGAIAPTHVEAVRKTTETLNVDIERYKKEKQEILKGSSAVGEANWVQEVDGKLGQVIGAKQWETQSRVLNLAGDKFDAATLFLQLCLVMGALSLLLKAPKLKHFFFSMMVVFGSLGGVFSAWAFSIATTV
ncbi:hypothetical protein BegalDRAFT_0758 [Beggiatoa alba B18LD]|uniref:DUF4337 domain-containing protein n=1 Tax=Beggiatoa alba B18LD TaxID=395493 RepID=I3CDH6_9GAMM|nr:DUF4337 family protein [Beggiatoa alba]EIJ41669.1 hypothetical protein BegalDRAFT_0758 [Beggiatoa alba B18LD]